MKRIVVVGMVAMDIIAKSSGLFKPGSSNIGQVSISAGKSKNNMPINHQVGLDKIWPGAWSYWEKILSS